MSNKKVQFMHDCRKLNIQYLKGVGPKRAESLQKLGIFTVKDLLYYIPRDYDDRSQIKSINSAVPGERVTVKGRIIHVNEFRPRKRGRVYSVLKIVVEDETNKLEAIWFNQPYLKDKFEKGKKIFLRGKVDINNVIKQMNAPDFELIETSHDEKFLGIVPIYRSAENISQRQFRSLIMNAQNNYLESLTDFLPDDIKKRNNFMNLNQALMNIHFPGSFREKELSRERLVFDEFFLFELELAERKKKVNSLKGIKFETGNNLIKSFLDKLPFILTEAQQKVLTEIRKDLSAGNPMNRLLQGDVGSGKTIIAIYALLQAVANGYQGVIMAPTEILAEQHFYNIKKLLSGFGIEISLLISGISNRKTIENKLENGGIKIIIGTHALIQEKIKFHRLGLVIIDEQHRFGVIQRKQLVQKGINPHLLVMTATPIPRTLALTLYGDLDLSVIDQFPPGRQDIITRWVAEDKRKAAYQFIKQEIAKGNQVYFVYPLVEESDKIDLKAATKMYEHLQRDIFPDLRLGLLHGRMSSFEKEKIMHAFKDGYLQMLISTTVIEVGIDIRNATIMVIEHAERFGLAQLHQLRGRVGRSEKQSFCLLMTSNYISLEAKKRMQIFVSSQNGFYLAEEDLKFRGPGEFFGTRQHGLPEFKIADLVKDSKIIPSARKEAFDFYEIESKKRTDKFLFLIKEIRERYGKEIDVS